MKNYLSFLTAVLLGFFASTATAQAPNSMTLVTSVALKGATHLAFMPEGDVETTYWDEEHAKVEINIDGQGLSRTQLKALIPLGVFNLETKTTGNSAVMALPGLDRFIYIKGKEFAPSMTFRITLPRQVQMERRLESPEEIFVEAH